MNNNLQRIEERLRLWGMPYGAVGFCILTFFMLSVASFLPPIMFHPGAGQFIVTIGFLALWRYSWGTFHFIRSLIYRKIIFPRWRKEVDHEGSELMPSQAYILITTYRIDAKLTARVFRSAVQEAVASNIPVTIVPSIVEQADEFIYRDLFKSFKPPERVKLRIVRIPGSGKRDALAQGFKAISRDMPPLDSIVVVMDGDTVLGANLFKRAMPFFKLRPNLGALTTDELAQVQGSGPWMQEWHDMRFAQRQILMSSLSLSKRVMTLTGRMSMFKASIVTNKDFIAHMTNDSLNHGRLGNFKFLTGDDKSSLYWVLKEGYEQIYLPDVQVLTIETPFAANFFKASSSLMFRWFGNMLRTNMRILKLGPRRMPFVVWWSFLDQRMSMWTSLAGPVFAAMLSIQYGMALLFYYLVWVLFVRWVMSLVLLSVRPVISWRYPFLLYYSQIYGALLKTYVLFRLDRQSWTRQKTNLKRGLSAWEERWNMLSSIAVHSASYLLFIAVIGLISGTLTF